MALVPGQLVGIQPDQFGYTQVIPQLLGSPRMGMTWVKLSVKPTVATVVACFATENMQAEEQIVFLLLPGTMGWTFNSSCEPIMGGRPPNE